MWNKLIRFNHSYVIIHITHNQSLTIFWDFSILINNYLHRTINYIIMRHFNTDCIISMTYLKTWDHIVEAIIDARLIHVVTSMHVVVDVVTLSIQSCPPLNMQHTMHSTNSHNQKVVKSYIRRGGHGINEQTNLCPSCIHLHSHDC